MDNVFCLQLRFGQYMITALRLYHEPLRQQGHTMSHLIPSHCGKPRIFTEQPLIENGNHKETSKRLISKNPVDYAQICEALF